MNPAAFPFPFLTPPPSSNPPSRKGKKLCLLIFICTVIIFIIVIYSLFICKGEEKPFNKCSIIGDYPKCCPDLQCNNGTCTSPINCTSMTCPPLKIHVDNASSITGNTEELCCRDINCQEWKYLNNSCGTNLELKDNLKDIIGNNQSTCCTQVSHCSKYDCSIEGLPQKYFFNIDLKNKIQGSSTEDIIIEDKIIESHTPPSDQCCEITTCSYKLGTTSPEVQHPRADGVCWIENDGNCSSLTDKATCINSIKYNDTSLEYNYCQWNNSSCQDDTGTTTSQVNNSCLTREVLGGRGGYNLSNSLNHINVNDVSEINNCNSPVLSGGTAHCYWKADETLCFGRYDIDDSDDSGDSGDSGDSIVPGDETPTISAQCHSLNNEEECWNNVFVESSDNDVFYTCKWDKDTSNCSKNINYDNNCDGIWNKGYLPNCPHTTVSRPAEAQ